MTTAQDYRNEAAAHLQEKEDSFQRCDTDGFVSQWAHGVNAELAERRAEITEAGKVATFWGLYDGDRRVAAEIIPTKYGRCWFLRDDEAERYGRKFVPKGEKSKVQKGLGLSERREIAPAWACLADTGAGLASVYVCTFRTGDEWGQDARLDG